MLSQICLFWVKALLLIFGWVNFLQLSLKTCFKHVLRISRARAVARDGERGGKGRKEGEEGGGDRRPRLRLEWKKKHLGVFHR